MRLKIMVAALVTGAMATTSFAIATSSAALAENGQLTSREVDVALQNVSGHLVQTRAGGGSTIQTDNTVRFTTKNAGDIVLTLPSSRRIHASADGSRKYLNGNSAVVVRPTDGGAQTLLVAANKSAPTTYHFGVANGYVVAW